MTANEILQGYWDMKLPVDVEAICNKLSVKIFQTSSVIDGRAYIDGNGVRSIAVNKDMPAERQRYCIAHELGHHALGHVQKKEDSFDYYGHLPEYESAAHEFARQLVTPKFAIDIVLKETDVNTVLDLAHLFGVQESKMNFRLNELDIIN